MPRLEIIIKEYFCFLDRKGKRFNFALGVVCTMLVGVFDRIAPASYTFSLLYLLPILFTTWFAGKRAGLIIAVFCTTFWSEHNYNGDIIVSTWNILSTFGIFCVASIMLASIRLMWETESALSRTDPLTGAMNIRAFSGLVDYEILKFQRQCCPFSFAYLDLDNFKQVNDRYGHKKGDELLKAVVACLVKHLRKTDMIARVGGDEFIILLPDTNLEAAKVVIQKVKDHQLELSECGELSITFSMGVLTFTNCIRSLDEIISLADKLMYEVKSSGKNDVRYAEYQGDVVETLATP